MRAVGDVDARIAAAVRTPLHSWPAALADGAQRVGWKIGLNIAEIEEHLGGNQPVIGHLTSATRLATGATYRAAGDRELRAEAELVVEMARDTPPDADADLDRGAIAGVRAAIELVDVGRPPDDLEGIVAANVFHRAFVLGETRAAADRADGEARMAINGTLVASARLDGDYVATVRAVATLLGAVGEQLRA